MMMNLDKMACQTICSQPHRPRQHGAIHSLAAMSCPAPETAPRRTVRVQCKSAQAPPDKEISEEDVVWDPKNLLKGERLSKGHIEKRLAERRAKMNPKGPRNMIISTAGEDNGVNGVTFSEIQNTVNGRAYSDHVDVHYMGIGDEFKDRIQVLNIDPPVFVIDSFLPKDLCSDIIAATSESELLMRSKVGGGVLTDEGLPVSQTRTSSSLLIDAGVQNAQPKLKEYASQVQDQIKRLFPFCGWGEPGVMPRPGQFTFEGLQVANYSSGQFFKSHEDGFPQELAGTNGFQRQATVLLYLNDVKCGGRTKFDWLDVSVEPLQGRALIFFPAFRNGLADERTLHTAEDAEDEKWVCQQWCACGLPKAARKGATLDGLSAITAGSASQVLGSSGLSSTSSLMSQPKSRQSPQLEASLSDAERLALTARHQKRVKRKQSKASKGKGFG